MQSSFALMLCVKRCWLSIRVAVKRLTSVREQSPGGGLHVQL